MRFLFFIFLLVSFSSRANDRVFQRLNRLYSTNSEKCLEIAKKYISKRPKQSIPYYFASSIYFDKFKTSTKESQRYSNLSRCLYYGASFEKKSKEIIDTRINWTHLKPEIVKESQKLIEELTENHSEKAKKLILKYQKFTNEKTNPKVTPKKKAPIKKEIVSAFRDGQYFGMPTGSEIISSANPEGEKELLKIINQERITKGMNPLVWDDDLAKAARYHAFDLATQKYFSHNTYDRKNGELIEVGDTFDRIKKFYTKSFVNSENIAAGNSSPEKTYTQWYNSPGHYENLFKTSSKKVGIGLYYDSESPYRYYWVFCTAL